MTFLRARVPTELRQVASVSATHGVWLENRKVRFQVVGKNRSGLPGRRVWEVRRRGRRASDRTEKRIHRFGVRLKRGEHVACHVSALASAITDETCQKAEM